MQLLRHTLLYIGVSILLNCSPIENPRQADQAERPPNIVFILADDLGWADLPAYGNQFNEAPNIDRLAAEGLRFTNAYAACPVCSPTRASILSGQYPARVGVIDFIPGHWRPFEQLRVPRNRTQYLPEEIITIGEAMQAAGYRTGYFGKWHLGNGPQHLPGNQGFDESIVYAGWGYYNLSNKMIPKQTIDPSVSLPEFLTDRSLEFIEQHKDSSFFLCLAHFDVHVPLEADSARVAKFHQKEKVEGYPCNAIYAAMIERVDESTGRLMAKLDALGLTENTVVVFYSDNGGLVKRFDNKPAIDRPAGTIYENDTLRTLVTSNAPLRAEKGTVYEGGIREPLIIRWPGRIQAAITNQLMSSVDLYPTFVSLAQSELPAGQTFDGLDISPQFLNPVTPETIRSLYWHYPVYHHDVPASAIRRGPWKLIHYLDTDRRALYNLEKDIGEAQDASQAFPDIANRLYEELDQWRQSVDAPMPVPNPGFDEARRYEWGRYEER